MKLFLVLLILQCSLKNAKCSAGDRSPYYQKCVINCIKLNCTEDRLHFREGLEVSIYLTALYWTCEENCQHECMWKTVEAFEERGWKVPQFYGKWPFIRILGMQEPASVCFSILNFYAHLKMIRKFRREVRSDSPFYLLWHIFCLVCLNGWIWSTVFHARDFPSTEFLDYSCAFSLILVSFYCMIIRLLYGKVQRFFLITIAIFFLAFFLNHISYLSSGQFDYGYNMEVNVVIGSCTAIFWFAWCTFNRIRQPYVWKCAVFMALTCLVTLLEIIDRPPIFWIFDFHSLWHLSTAGLICLFYSFAIDDCNYLRNEREVQSKISKTA